MELLKKLERTRTLKDIYTTPNNKIKSETKDFIIKDNKNTSKETNFVDMDKVNIGANTNAGAMIGSNVIMMHFDLPGIMSISRRIEDETKNIKALKDFAKKVIGLGKNYKNLSAGGQRRAAAQKIIDSNKKARGIK